MGKKTPRTGGGERHGGVKQATLLSDHVLCDPVAWAFIVTSDLLIQQSGYNIVPDPRNTRFFCVFFGITVMIIGKQKRSSFGVGRKKRHKKYWKSTLAAVTVIP